MDETSEQARTHFAGDHNCVQSVAMALAERYGIENPDIPRMLQPFGGGVSRCGEMCGAVTGAVLGIGLVFGRDGDERQEGRDTCMRLTAEYMALFRERRGTVRCNDLLGVDMSDPAERERVKEEGKFETLCPDLVAESVEIVTAIIDRERLSGPGRA
jgi:C_GCAxxG_C_C family probable redox protein